MTAPAAGAEMSMETEGTARVTESPHNRAGPVIDTLALSAINSTFIMLKPLSTSSCPRCNSSERVRTKLLATNFLLQWQFMEAFTVTRPGQFRNSPHTFGDHFVSGLFCDHCDLGFIPDTIAACMGIEPCMDRGHLSLSSRPFGVGCARSDISYDGSGNAVRPFHAIIWQSASDSVGVRVTLHAANGTEAKRILEREYGSDAICTIWNENDAQRLR